MINKNFIKFSFFQLKQYDPLYDIYINEAYHSFIIKVMYSLSGFIYKVKYSFMINLRIFARDRAIYKKKQFIKLNRLLTMRSIVIDAHLYKRMKSYIKQCIFLKWKNEKFDKKISLYKAKKKLQSIVSDRISIIDEIYTNAYKILFFYKQGKRINYYCDTMFNISILFLKSFISVIYSFIKKSKIKFIVHLENIFDFNDIKRIKYYFYHRLLRNKTISNLNKERIRNEIENKHSDINKYHKEYLSFIAFKYFSLFLQNKKYVNKNISSAFSKWKKNSLLMSIQLKIDYKEKLNDNLVYSNLELITQIAMFHILKHFKWFIFQCFRKIYPQRKKTIFDFELKTNENLYNIIKGVYKIERAKLRYINNTITSSDYNVIKTCFYIWKKQQDKIILNKVSVNTNNNTINDGIAVIIHIYKRIKLRNKAWAYRNILNCNLHKNKQIIEVMVKTLERKNTINKMLFMYRMSIKGRNNNNKEILFYNIMNAYYANKRKEDIREAFHTIKSKFFIKKLEKKTSLPFSFGNSPSREHPTLLSKDFYHKFISLSKIKHVIQSFAISTLFLNLKKIRKSTRKIMKAFPINKKINENMSIVALSIQKEIANKNKHIKFMKFLIKASSIFEPKNYIQKLFSHNTVKYYFMFWSNPSKLLLQTIKEDKDFQSDLKIKIYEYQESINYLENKIFEITMRCEKCKKCSELLKLSTLSLPSKYNTKSNKAPPKLVTNHDEDSLEDIDLLDDDLEGGEYYDYLEKTENEIKNNIIQIKNVKEPICERLKKEVEELYKEIETLSLN